MDDVDVAQRREELDRQIAIDAVKRRIAESMLPRDPASERYCIDCEGEIEPARLKALTATARCASCAHDFERGLRREQ